MHNRGKEEAQAECVYRDAGYKEDDEYAIAAYLDTYAICTRYERKISPILPPSF